MFRRAVLFLLCIVVCLFLAVSQGSRAAQQSDPTTPAIPDLSGEWTVTGYSDSKPVAEETIKIEQQNDAITATKITGDKAIHAGEVTWKGNLKAGKTRQRGNVRFSIQVQKSHGPDFKDRYFTTETLIIVSPDELRIGKTTLRRNGEITLSQPQQPAANANSPIALPQIQTISFDADYPIRSVNDVTTSVRMKDKKRLTTVEDWFFFNAKDAPYLLNQGTFGVDAGNSEDDISHYTLTPADGKQPRSLKKYTFKISGQGNGNSISGIVNEFEAFYRSGWIGVKATLQIGDGTGVFKGAIGTLNLVGDFSRTSKATCHVSGKITVSAAPVNVKPEEPFSKVLTALFKTDLANTR